MFNHRSMKSHSYVICEQSKARRTTKSDHQPKKPNKLDLHSFKVRFSDQSDYFPSSLVYNKCLATQYTLHNHSLHSRFRLLILVAIQS